MRLRTGLVAAILLAGLAACATAEPPAPAPLPPPEVVRPPVVPPPPEPRPEPRPEPPPPSPVVSGQSPASLPGWGQEDHLAAFQAWVAGCGVARVPAARAACDEARTLARGRVSPSDARAWFERRFVVVEARTPDGAPGRLTAYFAPEYEARRTPDAEFDAPVLAAPSGWSRGQVLEERAEIEQAAAEGRPMTSPLAWMRAEDLFFMQIQGSGYLTFEDGARARAAYAADNGRPFVGIATPMARQGLLPANGTSGEAIRAWLAAHRGQEARAVTALNPRYIFFRMDADDGGHPLGAAGIPLPPRRSVAVDPAHWAYGELAWVEAEGGNLVGARASYRGLVVTLDTGSAIRGPVRADLYIGRGEAAGDEAGAVRHPLRMWRLVPRF